MRDIVKLRYEKRDAFEDDIQDSKDRVTGYLQIRLDPFESPAPGSLNHS
jgi:hypothetical protein